MNMISHISGLPYESKILHVVDLSYENPPADGPASVRLGRSYFVAATAEGSSSIETYEICNCLVGSPDEVWRPGDTSLRRIDSDPMSGDPEGARAGERAFEAVANRFRQATSQSERRAVFLQAVDEGLVVGAHATSRYILMSRPRVRAGSATARSRGSGAKRGGSSGLRLRTPYGIGIGVLLD